MMDTVDAFEIGHHGAYPVAFDRRLHGGIHLNPGEQIEPVRAIADGEVVAYRVCKNPLSDGTLDATSAQPLLNSNAGFVLLRHTTHTGEGRTITYYSLYMHLLDMTNLEHIAPQPHDPPETGSAQALPKWLLDTAAGKDGVVQPGGAKKVYRKDMLGYLGQHQGVAHLHFEIFMTQADFSAWFEPDGLPVQLGEKRPAQPTSSDYWGHAYFVIHGPQDFVAQPAGMNDIWFPRVPGGAIGEHDTLYVEAWFNLGRRYTRAWIDRGNTGAVSLLTPEPVADPYDNDTRQYEYDLYSRAITLYSACPSDGYEMLRFGRILSDSPTLTAKARATWVAVPFDENGTLGYLNIAAGAIIKLSDADFPFFMGWQKIDERNTPFAADGLCEYARLCGLTGIQASQPSARPLEYDKNNQDETNLQLASYIQNTDGIRAKLKGLVCHARSEWDASNNAARYQGLNEPEGFFGKQKETNPDGYAKFIAFLNQFQFLDHTPLAGQKLWFFHPLAFIRHFRKCGWSSVMELTQCLPRKVIDQTKNGAHQAVYPTSILRWEVARSRAERFALQINIALRKYGISINKLRTAYFMGNAIQETIYLSRTSELGGAQTHYAPWYGRGVIQLTFEENYKRYGDFHKWSEPPSRYRDSLEVDLSRAGFYWVSCAKPVGASHNINAEADKLPRFVASTLINVCSDYNYHDKSCRASLYRMEFLASSEFEKSARAVNTGNSNSTGKLNGLIPRTNIFLASVAKLTDILIDYVDAYSQKE
jgi:predicted chitinase